MRQGGGRIRHPGPLRANDVSRFPGLRRFPSPGCYFVVGVLFVVLLYSAGLFPGPAGAPVRAPPPAITPAALVGNVTGSVFGSRGPGTTPVPLPGVEVNATDPDFVTTVASSVTNASGEYALTVPPGFYYIWSHRSGAWGGGGVPDRINVSAGNQTVNLTAYPYLGYGNSTLVLPDWNRLAPYLHKGNTMDSQQPMLSWSQDGAFYVNATDQLVFYSFPNRTVTDIAPWVPLYENVMNYAGWENEEFLTPDGSWVYGLGCLASCTSSTHVTLYAVNVSTGRTFEYNWTTVDGNLTTNAQVNLVGTEGNLSTAVLIDDKGHLWLYSLWNGTEWRGPALPYFEANNIYWIPYLSSYVNVEAEGTTTDGIDQWALRGPGDGTTFTDVFSSHYGSGFLSNAVTGPAFNLSSRTLVFDSFSKGSWYTFEYNVTPGNVLDDLTVLDAQVPGISTYADEKLTIDITADEHRASVLEGGPAFSAAFWPFFDNRSFVVDPFSQVFYDTNQTPGVFYNTTNSPDQAAASSDSEDGLYFNASYLISPGAYNSDAGTCPINGGNGSAIGTIWWLWKVGGPEFPTPVTAPLSQDAAPGPITVTNSTGATNVQLNWTSPDVGQYPLLNYTVEWGLTPGSVLALGVDAQRRARLQHHGSPPSGTRLLRGHHVEPPLARTRRPGSRDDSGGSTRRADRTGRDGGHGQFTHVAVARTPPVRFELRAPLGNRVWRADRCDQPECDSPRLPRRTPTAHAVLLRGSGLESGGRLPAQRPPFGADGQRVRRPSRPGGPYDPVRATPRRAPDGASLRWVLFPVRAQSGTAPGTGPARRSR